MSTANASAASGDGSLIATQLISSKEYGLSLPADADGHVIGTRFEWLAFFANGATNALNLEVAELFNAQANSVRVRGVWIIPTMTSITGHQLGYNINRLSAVGTGGTTVTPRSMDPAAPALSASITARFGATGGATSSYTYFSQYNWNEETSAPIGMLPLINLLPVFGDRVAEIVLPNGSGIQVKIGQLTGTAAGITQAMIHFVVDN